MDDLTFRRTIYADPQTKDKAVLAAAKEDPSKQQFWDEIKQLDKQMAQAAHIPVPDNLVEKLMLKQGMEQVKERKQKRPWYLALAASVALIGLLSFNMIPSSAGLQADIIAHVSDDYLHKEVSMRDSGPELSQVNAKMATFNGQISNTIGEILSANYCYLDTIKSLHLIIQGENGLVSLFVMPKSISESLESNFSNAQLLGSSFLLESAKIIVVGKDPNEVQNVSARAMSAMKFSA